MQPTFGVSTWLWTSPFNTASAQTLFPKIKKMGYDVVEIPVEYPDLIDGKKVREALEEYGLKAVVCGAFGPSRDLTHADPAVHQTCFDYIADCFKLCKDWDADFLAGPMYAAVGKTRMLSPEERKVEWDRAVTNLQKVCSMASEEGLSLAIEALNRFESDLINTVEDVQRLIKDINHDAAKIMVDVFHMNIEEPDMEKAVKLAGDKLIHLQIADNYRGTPGTGSVRWDSLCKGLEGIAYDGVISIESFTPEIKELAGAVCIWRHLADDQDQFASDGLEFMKKTFNY
ncbi:D-psicose/D-tagatose/L-ribulose 3-epimerase [Catalinimonas alkaloidigena]|uniref:sugar phosphate isomerase/epimerase family protein n=1 Tax=Catalinimonas alkaloidigena TaxID=1075417 RepID=UPI00240667E8|nr:sugar phosphate isomerase/epimerase [Catalinimonas alkaloidigena]MDF9798041.1 D-psicose/D-tagatose/L-ribulose 3-epimerase [Catalinimonas alkaloidigena]